MKSSEIKKSFLSFFEKRGHKVLPSSSLVPDDPTLLLTTAGMVQFKPIFQGDIKPEFTRITTVQKCCRTTDIEKVGHTARHLTFFEMLGNFSFGDYYKKEMIPWAWEFLTKDLGLDPNHLWVSVFTDDDEAFKIWKDDVGVDPKRIVRLGEDSNFWSAGPVGPCGPCSEIHYDFGKERGCKNEDCTVGCDCDRFLEIWNLVFMQYYRSEDGKLTDLPAKNIDTGFGVERAASILQGVKTNFETDLIGPIIDKISALSGVNYGAAEKSDISLKIIADHIRAVTFLINDGVIPSNEGRGYVLRRLLRRAIRHGRLLGIDEGFAFEVASVVIDLMRQTYPDLKDNLDYVKRIMVSEEERFLSTLKQGLGILDNIISVERSKESAMISGDLAFQLYDTYGFPIELTREIAQENGFSVDDKLFKELMAGQRAKAKAARVDSAFESAGQVHLTALDSFGKTEFTGYNSASQETVVLGIIKDNDFIERAGEGDEVEIILKETPIYAEKGGQVADHGVIETETGRLLVNHAFYPAPDLIVHKARVLSGHIEEGQRATASIDISRRASICRNHTATHILHWALSNALGRHIKQAGSSVDEEKLRFDFTHFEAIPPSTLRKVEKMVNEKIMANLTVSFHETSLEAAKAAGVIALFGEKYGETVRVLEVGDFSRELCGGTHVSATSDIGLFKIAAESSIAANTRRVEATTALLALNEFYLEEDELKAAAAILRCGDFEVAKRTQALQEALKAAEKRAADLKRRLAGADIDGLISSTQSLRGVELIAQIVQADDIDGLRSFVDILKEKAAGALVVLGASKDDRAFLLAHVPLKLIEKGFDAGEIIKEISPLIGGGGGGRKEMAQAGGKNPGGLEAAIERAVQYVRKKDEGSS
ncbi:MAG: alanine--tRNA ligase [Actinomycetota bacterium]|nr:alanine--tRNA ligase [Actinomycetota bacterium]